MDRLRTEWLRLMASTSPLAIAASWAGNRALFDRAMAEALAELRRG